MRPFSRQYSGSTGAESFHYGNINTTKETMRDVAEMGTCEDGEMIRGVYVRQEYEKRSGKDGGRY